MLTNTNFIESKQIEIPKKLPIVSSNNQIPEEKKIYYGPYLPADLELKKTNSVVGENKTDLKSSKAKLKKLLKLVKNMRSSSGATKSNNKLYKKKIKFLRTLLKDNELLNTCKTKGTILNKKLAKIKKLVKKNKTLTDN